MKKTIEHKVARISTAVDNSINYPTILAALKKVGYTLAMLQTGKAYVEEFRMLHQDCAHKYGEQYGLGQTFQQDLKQVKQVHANHRKLVKIVFQKDTPLLNQLGLKKQISTTDQWLAYADNFYSVLLKDGDQLTSFGVSTEELAQLQASVQALIDNRKKHMHSKGDAQNAIQRRNEALRKMEAWMSDFRKTARYALRDEPQLLESLGIIVRSPAKA